jgi:hypothetical protein
MHSNRIKNALDQQPDGKPSSLHSPADGAVGPGHAVSTPQIYAAAWSLAKRDWELNRLFNSWYYEI